MEVPAAGVAWPYADLRNPFSVDEGGSTAEYLLPDPDTMPDLALGSHVLIHDVRGDKGIWIDAIVVGLRAISPFNPERQNLLYLEIDDNPTDVLREVSGPHTHQRFLIRLRLVEELYLQNRQTRSYNLSAVQRPPSARSFLSFPRILHSEGDAPTLKDMLRIKERGLVLGAVGFGNSPYRDGDDLLEYRLDIENLDNRHMFIVGESGSGKTVLLKSLAWKLREFSPSCRIIVTDVQGDICQLLLPNLIPAPQHLVWQGAPDSDAMNEALAAMGPFNLVIPASSGEEVESIRNLEIVADDAGHNVYRIGLRLQDLTTPSDVEYLYRVSSEQVAMLLDEEAEGIQERRDSVTVERLREIIQNRISNARGNQITSASGTQYYVSTAQASIRALRNLGNHFDFHQPSMQATHNPLDCLRSEGVTILYLEHLPYEERLMWEMQLVHWLYENKRDPTETYVFVDEAHQIVPAKPPGIGSRGTFDRLRGNFERLAREGRKFGTHLILSTQSPRDLHDIVPDQCPTRVVMKIDPRNARAAHVENELAHIAARFRHGQFWFLSPFNNTSDWVRIHSPAPPLPHQPMKQFWTTVEEAARETIRRKRKR